MKTKIKVTRIEAGDDLNIGDEGYIDGYLVKDRPYIVAVINKEIHLLCFYQVEVIE